MGASINDHQERSVDSNLAAESRHLNNCSKSQLRPHCRYAPVSTGRQLLAYGQFRLPHSASAVGMPVLMATFAGLPVPTSRSCKTWMSGLNLAATKVGMCRTLKNTVAALIERSTFSGRPVHWCQRRKANNFVAVHSSWKRRVRS